MQLSKRTSIFLLVGSGVILLYKLLNIFIIPFTILRAQPSHGANSIGIIGGADGPTAVFLTTRLIKGSFTTLLPIVIELAFLIFVFIFAVRSLRKAK